MIKTFILAVIVVFILCSCSKDSGSAGIKALSDTLSLGWSKKIISEGNFFSDIVFSDSLVGVASGKESYLSRDGGKSWNNIGTLSLQTVNIEITKDNKLFAATSNNLYRSTDLGLTYTLSPSGSYTDVIFIDNNTGFSVGTPINLKKTTDGGLTWQNILPINGISPKNSRYATACFFSQNQGIIAIGDSIFISTNNLNNWTPSIISGISPNTGTSLFANSQTSIYAGTGDGKIYFSSNGGISFTLKSSLPKTSTIVNNISYLDIHFTSLSTGYASYGSRIYKTTDAGSTWNIIVALGNANINEIHFTDENHGWACTTKGDVLKYIKL